MRRVIIVIKNISIQKAKLITLVTHIDKFSNIYMFLIITCLQLALYPFGIYDVKQK